MKQKVTAIISLFIFSIMFSQNLYASDLLEMDRGDGTKIEYYLVSSKSTEESLLVLIQGSDCNSVHSNKLINEAFPNVLPGADILTVEKYGIDATLQWNSDLERTDCPDKYIDKDSPEQRIKDYTQVLNALNKGGKYKRIVLVGGSEGAVIANILASQLSYIDSTVSLNGGGRRFIGDVLHSIEMQSPSVEAYNESANGFIGFSKHILNSKPFDLNMSGHGYRWWKSMLEIDQTMVLSKIDTPVLLIQSGKDKNVSVSLAKAQAEALSRNKPNITFKIYGELDHSFKPPGGTSEVGEVIHDIRLWLTQPIQGN
ncbi:MAG: acyl-CoA thioester hydrolase/BAAT C-terminal domain-containing protein [Psychromonas sp.]